MVDGVFHKKCAVILSWVKDFDPIWVILHFAGNDIEDKTGIDWVAYADDTGNIQLSNVPKNPAGMLRTILPPDSLLYKNIFRSQVCMLIKIFLNQYSMKIFEGIKEFASNNNKYIVENKVTIMKSSINEERYIRLLQSFSKLLHSQHVQLIFLSDDDDFYGYTKIKQATHELEEQNLLNHYAISEWFVAGKDYPFSLQGHKWGKEAHRALAGHLFNLIKKSENSNEFSK